MTQRILTGRGFLSVAVAAPFIWALMAGAASAQQAYYYPQSGNGPVTINYGALSPYAPQQPYGVPALTAPLAAQPQSVFAPQAPAYVAPAYAVPALSSAPRSQFLPGQAVPGQMMPQGLPINQGSIIQAPVALAGPGYGGRAYSPITYTASPIQAPFVAPYGNPALSGQSYPGGPLGQVGMPQPGAKPFDPANMTRKSPSKKAAASAPAPSMAEPSAVEAAAAAQVAAVEEQLESGQMAAAPAEPLAAPTPPEAPAEIPASVPSPVQEAAVVPTAPAVPAPTTSIADGVAPAEPAESDASDAATTETAAVEPDAEAAPAAEEAAAEETPADTGGAAALPAGGTRIVFEGTADDLPATATGALDAIAQKMMSDESLKVQVLAYSSSIGDNESQARRKALSRGLEVRKYLIGQGVRSNRIDVRALGSKSEGSPADRVDIVPAAS